MELIYRAYDGKEFKTAEECIKHEDNISNGIIMLNRKGEVVHRTENAIFVWLRDEAANLAFHALAREQGDKMVSSIAEGEDYGLFYWEEGYDEYRWFDTDMLNNLVKMKQLIKEKGGKL